ncbi:MAG TPA: ParB/RepB/Spo0J family partition protein [Roseiarcus sp.]|nr:ParB/RepB/Spo0J family partition protein [Roseiarcus sp.]
MPEDAVHSESRNRLGRGLAALLGATREETDPAPNRGAKNIPVEFLRPNSRNPRKRFDDGELDDLAASIREHGVIQPILVRPIPHSADAFEIVAGERRWRAAQRAGRHDVPILVIEAGDRESLQIGIIENVQRADLNALEEAAGYTQLISEYGYSHSDVARVVGKSRSHIANTLRLTNLSDHVKSFLRSGAISAGHARALLAAADPDQVADRILREGLTVRDVEQLGQERSKPGPRGKERSKTDPDTRALEQKVGLALGAKVAIRRTGDETGDIRIAFASLEQLDDYCRRLCREPG